LEEFASESVGSAELSAALRRAMRQLEQVEQGQDPQAAKEAMKALAESLDLTKMELQQIAQAAKDMKRLEEALEALQRARSLNEQNALDSEGTGEFQTLADYAELYAELMGEEPGGGTGGEGFGEGGEVSEDDSGDTDFRKEQEKVATRAGKILLSLKGKGMSEAGEAKKEYRQLVGQVKQGVSEAISQEQIPPGYHEGIRGYFDSIDEQFKNTDK
jgi:tetratricopeptide (TPR) repeat protein